MLDVCVGVEPKSGISAGYRIEVGADVVDVIGTYEQGDVIRATKHKPKQSQHSSTKRAQTPTFSKPAILEVSSTGYPTRLRSGCEHRPE
eukprot:5199810-Pyramimonas_sp.AAC.1